MSEVKPTIPPAYIPFGDEWKTEMMKWRKEDLVADYRNICMDRICLKEENEKMAHELNMVVKTLKAWNKNHGVWLEMQDRITDLLNALSK